jgi:hypothetical protein
MSLGDGFRVQGAFPNMGIVAMQSGNKIGKENQGKIGDG